MDQDETWHEGTRRLRPYYVGWRPSPPPQRGIAHNFRPMSVVAKGVGQDATWYGGRPSPGDIVLDGDSAPPLQKGGRAPPNFRPMSIVAKWAGWIKMSLGMEVGLGQATLC